jgi:hydroxymethylpyrimidine kinase/phosphomethylpyrimidine kinase
MAKTATQPVALTVAGSDSGGGAGAQADLKTFAAHGVHGTSAITCLTAQNPSAVTAVQPTRVDMLRAQLRAVFDGLRPDAIKTGMLFSNPLVRCVSDFLAGLESPRPPLVVDPVMVSTSGAQLLKPAAIRAVKQDLLPLATLITPNLDEASLLLDQPVRTVPEARDAARILAERHGCSVLVKGGHREGISEAVDVLWHHGHATLLRSPWIPGAATHGTGCTLSAAITAQLALGRPLGSAVRRAKDYITQAIGEGYRAGAHEHLRHLPRR